MTVSPDGKNNLFDYVKNFGKIKFSMMLSKYIFPPNPLCYKTYSIYDKAVFTAGCFFKGQYPDDQDHLYNKKSLTIRITGLPLNNLLLVSLKIAAFFKQSDLLIRHFSNKYFYRTMQRSSTLAE